MTEPAFDERYGEGAFARLTRMLEQPCLTFAAIAGEFGVTRERVRQWHRRFLPQAPGGHERQRLCALYRQRRRLFEDGVFRVFFQRARAHFGPGRIEPIRSGTGYRRSVVLIDKQVVALRDATGRRVEDLAPTLRYRGLARYLFIRCEEEFVFVPAALAGTRGCELIDPRFRNSFAAFADEPQQTGEGQPAGGPGLPIR